MGCACQKGPNSNQPLPEIKIKKVTRMVNFEGNLVPQESIPQDSLFILGAWYASAEALPDELKVEYSKLFNKVHN